MDKYLVPRDFYNLIAEGYDKRYEEFVNPSRTKKQADFIEEHLAHCSHILDVACGNGRHSIELSKRNFNMTGLDFAKGMILIARQKASAVKIPLVVGDMVHLPFRSSTFDAAICMWNSLQDILGAAKRKTAVQEMSRVLKQAGTIIIDLPNPYWAEKSRKQLEEKFRCLEARTETTALKKRLEMKNSKFSCITLVIKRSKSPWTKLISK